MSSVRTQVELFIKRLVADWDRMVPKRQVPYKEALALHTACGGFLYLMDLLKQKVPQSDFNQSVDALHTQFMSGFNDTEIDRVLTNTAPPLNLQEVSFMKSLDDFSKISQEIYIYIYQTDLIYSILPRLFIEVEIAIFNLLTAVPGMSWWLLRRGLSRRSKRRTKRCLKKFIKPHWSKSRSRSFGTSRY